MLWFFSGLTQLDQPGLCKQASGVYHMTLWSSELHVLALGLCFPGVFSVFREAVNSVKIHVLLSWLLCLGLGL